MKSIIITLTVASLLVAVGILIHVDHPSTPPVAGASDQPMPPPRPESAVPPVRTGPQPGLATGTVAVPSPTNNTGPDKLEPKGNPALKQTIDTLLSPATTFAQKRALFEQLRQAGELDQAISELKQRAADNPGDPNIATTLGEAQINQLRALSDAGGDNNAIGILAMQADQNFNTALGLDPSNWEAEFFKATALSHWPPALGRDNEAIQQLSNLIDQQATMTSQPQFAQTYVVLGEEYQKLGQTDYAVQTWRLGSQSFPNDPTLQQKLASQ